MKTIYFFGLIISLMLMLSSCNGDDKEPIVTQDETPYQLEYGNLPEPNLPEDNPLTVSGVALGRMLFYEKRMSKDGTQSCASCHMQAFAFTDTARFSTGVRGLKGGRQAMSVFNMAWHSNEFFWDGRAHLLRDQSLMPIQDELEMDETLDNVVLKLSLDQDYRDQFMRAFGSEEINAEKISLALEQFMNSIVSSNSKYDRYLNGEETLTESEERGRYLFFTEYSPFFPEKSGADCAHCHGGDNFENDSYMNNGLDSDFDDLGREKVTANAENRGEFKVTSLRNIALTAPYMHDGRFSTLEEIVEHYNSGLKPSATLPAELERTREKGLQLSEEDKKALVAFLKTLTDDDLVSDSRYSDPFN